MHRRHRLRSRADFANVMRNGGSVRAPGFVVRHVCPGGSNVARVGFSTARGLGSAVVRNRTRRRLREAVRPLVTAMVGADVVIVARPDLVDTPPADLARALRRAMSEAGLLRSDVAPGQPWTRGGTMDGQNPSSDVPEGTPS